MKVLRQGIRSTNKKEKNKLNDDNLLQLPTKKEHDIFIKITDLKETIYTDQAGQIPCTYSKGNRYIILAIHIDDTYTSWMQ